MTRKIVDGVERDMTPEEEQAYTQMQEQVAIEQQAEKDAQDAKEANIASTKAKLEALGLTTDEVKDTFGL